MRKTNLVVLASALALAAVAARAEDCKLVRSSSLDLAISRSGHIVVPVTINDTPQNMLVEINSSFGEVTQKLVDTLGLKAQSLNHATSRNPILAIGPIYLGNGEHAKSAAEIASLVLGMEHVTYTDFIVNPHLSDEDGRVAGTIGHDIWSHFDLDFDFASGKLNLFSPDHCPGKVVYWASSYTDADARLSNTGALTVPMSLDGHDVDATLDPGSPETFMTLSEAHAAFGIDATSPGVETITTADGTPRYRMRFKTLSLSGITVENPMVYLEPDAIGEQAREDQEAEKMNGYHGNAPISTPHLSVGLDVLSHLHLYIAYKEEKIYATAAGAH